MDRFILPIRCVLRRVMENAMLDKVDVLAWLRRGSSQIVDKKATRAHDLAPSRYFAQAT